MPDTAPANENTTAAKPGKKKAAQRAKDAARDAGQTAKRKATEAVDAATETFDANPFGALAGAIAVGAVAAAFIPATRRELEALGPWTDRMREALADAFDAAKDAGTGELTAAGLTFAAASDGVGGIVGKIVKAASAATTAAAGSVKGSRGGGSDASAASAQTVDNESEAEPEFEPTQTQA